MLKIRNLLLIVNKDLYLPNNHYGSLKATLSQALGNRVLISDHYVRSKMLGKLCCSKMLSSRVICCPATDGVRERQHFLKV